MFLSIFTPTYNRAYIIENLYKSLCRQTFKDFEWIIVDDGSNDNTREIVNKFIQEKIISIKYFYQENSGKPSAHNKGVSESSGDLFMCVDSDDYLKDDACEIVYNTWKHVSKPGIIGIIAYRENTAGTNMTAVDSCLRSSTFLRAVKKYGLSGEMVLIYSTAIIKKVRFPKIEGEKFIQESYLYTLLDDYGKMFFLHKSIYVLEYREDGYTKNAQKLYWENWRGYILSINTKLKRPTCIKDYFTGTIVYNSVMIAHKQPHIFSNAVYPIVSFVLYLPSILFSKKFHSK